MKRQSAARICAVCSNHSGSECEEGGSTRAMCSIGSREEHRRECHNERRNRSLFVRSVSRKAVAPARDAITRGGSTPCTTGNGGGCPSMTSRSCAARQSRSPQSKRRKRANAVERDRRDRRDVPGPVLPGIRRSRGAQEREHRQRSNQGAESITRRTSSEGVGEAGGRGARSHHRRAGKMLPTG
jgi:hypothetical protein